MSVYAIASYIEAKMAKRVDANDDVVKHTQKKLNSFFLSFFLSFKYINPSAPITTLCVEVMSSTGASSKSGRGKNTRRDERGSDTVCWKNSDSHHQLSICRCDTEGRTGGENRVLEERKKRKKEGKN